MEGTRILGFAVVLQLLFFTAMSEVSTKFYMTGAEQAWTVPAGIYSVELSLWGAGGAAGPHDDAAPGGAGGYAFAGVNVIPGDHLTIIVGSGALLNDCYFGGNGGGRSAVLLNGVEILTAGGGGGSGLEGAYGGTACEVSNSRGGNNGGTGGTSSSGGLAPAGVYQGDDGAQFLGGNGYNDNTVRPFGGGRRLFWMGGGGAGGGGYYGGGAGSASDGVTSGGGGGSCFASGNVLSPTLDSGSGSIAPHTQSLLYVPGVASGALGGGTGTDGGDGLVVISHASVCTVPPGNLDSSFSPTMGQGSGLSLENGVSVLTLYVSIPSFYERVTFLFPLCSKTPNVTFSTDLCHITYTVQIRYLEYCNFFVDNSGEEYVMSGRLNVAANYTHWVPEFQLELTNQVSSPLSWFAALPREIAVTTDTIVEGRDICPVIEDSSATCNGHACSLLEGYHQCVCSVCSTGQLCQVDVCAPTLVCPTNIELYTEDLTKLLPSYVSSPTVNDNVDGLAALHISRSITSASGTFQIEFESFPAGDNLSNLAFTVGLSIVTYTAIDTSGLASNCSFSVQVVDAGPPTITCPPDQVTNKWQQWPAATAVDVVEGIVATYYQDPPASNPSNLVYPITYCAQDTATNEACCTFSVTYDTTPPNFPDCDVLFQIDQRTDVDILSPSGMTEVELCALSFVSYATVSWVAPTAVDNLSGVSSGSLLFSPPLTSPLRVEVGAPQYASYTVFDHAGNSATCPWSAIAVDLCPPVLTCGASSVSTDAGVGYATFNLDSQFLAVDNVGVNPSTVTSRSIAQYSIGSWSYTYQACDTSDNCASCNMQITVVDIEPPSVNCPVSLQVVPTDVGQDTSTYNANTAELMWTDNDLTFGTLGNIALQEPGPSALPAILPLGTTTLFYVATDPSGNTRECNVAILVVDQEPPTVVCPATTTIAVEGVVPTIVLAQDNVAVTSISYFINGVVYEGIWPCPVSHFLLDTTATVTIVVADAADNEATCSFGVTVTDNIAPTLQGCLNVIQSTDDDQVYATINFGVTATDNVQVAGAVTYTLGPYFTVGSHVVTARAYDTSGNSGACAFSVTVNAKCGDLLLNDAEQCDGGLGCLADCTCGTAAQTGLEYDAYSYEPIAFGCQQREWILKVSLHLPGVPLAQWTMQTQALVLGSFQDSTNTQATITSVRDDVIVELEVRDQDLEMALNLISMINWNEVYADLGGATATAEIVQVPVQNPPGGIGMSCSGYTSRTLYTSLPESETTNPYCLSNPYYCQTQAIDWNDVYTLDPDFDGDVTCNYESGDRLFVVCLHIHHRNILHGTTRVECTGSNTEYSQTCFLDVVVRDRVPPAIMPCPISFDTGMDLRSNVATLVWTPTFWDDTSATQFLAITSSERPDHLYGSGSHHIIWTVSDEAGNTASCDFIVSVYDWEPPAFSNCENIYISTDLDQAIGSLQLELFPTATDNVGLANAVAWNFIGPYPIGTTHVTGSASDGLHTVSCAFDVYVVDDQPPTIMCDDLSALRLETATDSFTMSEAERSALVSAQDNSGVVSVSFFPDITQFSLGHNTVTVTAKDNANHIATCQLIVPVFDIGIPQVTCPSNLNLVNTVGTTVTNVAHSASATDNSGQALQATTTYVHTDGESTTFGVGITEVTYTATDAAENTGSCTFSVNVFDGVSPTWTCPSVDYVHYLSQGIPVWPVPVASDNIGVVTSTFPSNSLSLGDNLLTYTAVDAAGNVGECFFTVTVVDDVVPEFVSCPEDLSLSLGILGAVIFQWSVSATDNLTPTAELTITNAQNHQPAGNEELGLGVHTYTFIVTDGSGNTNACTFQVTVSDETPPIVSCPSSKVQRSTDTQANTAVVSFSVWAVSDNSGQPVAVSYSHQPGSIFPLGTTVVQVTARDHSNNYATCSFQVTVLESYKPPSLSSSLVKVAIVERAAGVTPQDGLWGADIEYVTLVPFPHRAFISSEQISTGVQSGYPMELTASDSGASGYYQRFRLQVDFEDCSSDHFYDLQHYTLCRPDDCSIGRYDFVLHISLTAVNFCDDNELQIVVTATMVTVDQGQRAVYTSADNARVLTDAPTLLPPTKGLFFPRDVVSTLIPVSSPNVEISGVSVLAASKTFFSDAQFNQEVATIQLVSEGTDYGTDISHGNEHQHAWFSYTEGDVPLGSTYYTRLTASVLIEYAVVNGGSRRLLSISQDYRPLTGANRELLQSSSGASAPSTVNSRYLAVGNDPVLQQFYDSAAVGDSFALVSLCDLSSIEVENRSPELLITLHAAVSAILSIAADSPLVVCDYLATPSPGGLLAVVVLRSTDSSAWLTILENSVTDVSSQLHDFLCIDANVFFHDTFLSTLVESVATTSTPPLPPVDQSEANGFFQKYFLVVVAAGAALVVCLATVGCIVFRKTRSTSVPVSGKDDNEPACEKPAVSANTAEDLDDLDDVDPKITANSPLRSPPRSRFARPTIQADSESPCGEERTPAKSFGIVRAPRTPGTPQMVRIHIDNPETFTSVRKLHHDFERADSTSVPVSGKDDNEPACEKPAVSTNTAEDLDDLDDVDPKITANSPLRSPPRSRFARPTIQADSESPCGEERTPAKSFGIVRTPRTPGTPQMVRIHINPETFTSVRKS